MNWPEVLISSGVSLPVGLLLWAFLPRGVVLTRRSRTSSPIGGMLHDTWEIQNDSPHPIRLTEVSFTSLGTLDESGKVVERTLPNGGAEGVSLHFDDLVLDVARSDSQLPWREVTVAPGDTLEAPVTTNASLKIRYRRAGPLGVLERRQLVIHGSA